MLDLRRRQSLDFPIGLSHRPRDGSVVSSLHCMNDPQPEGHIASHIERRKFLATLGGAVTTWPFAARAQQPQRVRRIGVFMPGTADNAEYQLGNAAFLQALGELGWIVGRSVHIDYRWGAGDVERYRAIATDLVSLAPDAVLAEGTATVSALQKATRSVPIVFVDENS
jgi:putative tryptophan/tyrosine transport system substrate-binding protein